MFLIKEILLHFLIHHNIYEQYPFSFLRANPG